MLLCAPLCQLSPVWTSGSNTQLWRRSMIRQWRASNEGFGPQPSKKSKNFSGSPKSDDKQLSTWQSEKVLAESTSLQNTKASSEDDKFAPRLTTITNFQPEKGSVGDSFEERLEAIKRSAEEKKKLEDQRMYGRIDYDAPDTAKESKTVSLPVRVGIGIAVAVFGLIFAFGDILPSVETNVQNTGVSSTKEKDLKDSAQLKEQLQQFLAVLKNDPEDLNALEGAAVSYAEAGEFSKSESMLLQLLKKKPMDVEALRLLGEVENALGKFAESASSYRNALKISPNSITLWKALAEVIISQGKPDLAVKEVSAERDRLSSSEPHAMDDKTQNADPDEATLVQINLLLGKIYVEWGHVSDALAVYDSIIQGYPEDFRGYLAKGLLLKEQGLQGEAERMFIQANFFAPESMKGLVDRYTKR
ncbi:hypothetical protein GOP47_0020468 [Adiantum capillus-veneris]|uniref:Uncharacterized protein n=1 Tax=Adiantum capillus-veneris TaxID=13818 RepID=A0A9D4UA49_ADICA|nr:hypothetical protein GOP47_0020468 [Adiantum capillus-veneris]